MVKYFQLLIEFKCNDYLKKFHYFTSHIQNTLSKTSFCCFMGRLKRSRISVRFIRVLNTDGSTKKYYEIEDKGKRLTLIPNPPQNSQSSSFVSTELLLAANKLNITSQKQQSSDELGEITESSQLSSANDLFQHSSSLSELESSPFSSDASLVSSSVSQENISISHFEKPITNSPAKKSSFADEFLKIETFAPIMSFLASDSTAPTLSCPSSPEINLDSDFAVDEVPLNLDMYNNENLTENSHFNIPSIKADQNDFGFNFPNLLTATSEEFPNLFSTW